MNRRILTLGILFLFVFSAFIPMSLGFNIRITNTREQPSKLLTNGNTLYVGGTGGGNYTSIQDAINDAVDGDTVFVYDDSSPYYELLAINKSINLIGEDRDTTVIDGDYKGIVVNIQADDVTVSGFTIIECRKEQDHDSVIKIIGSENVIIKDNIISIGPEPWFKPYIAGVHLEDSSNILIQDNIIIDDGIAGRTSGIRIDSNSPFNNVSGNEIYEYARGIYIFSDDNIIYGNYIHDNTGGIRNDGNRNNIIKNIITDNEFTGIFNGPATNTLFSENTISYNGGGIEFDAGLILVEGDNNEVKNNLISNNNPVGVHLLGANNNDITDNHFYNNNIIGVYADFSYNCVISRNNFIDNDMDVYFDADRPWKNKNQWSRNYWDYPRTWPKLIFGRGTFIFFQFPWINIDWNPASEPYDIGV